MRASVRVLLIAIPVTGVLVATRRAGPDANSTVEDRSAREDRSIEESAPAPGELAAPPHWIRVSDEVAATVDTAEASGGWLEEAATRQPPRDDALDRPRDRHDAILEKLEATRVRGLEFREQDLDQVVGRLGALTGLEFRVAPNVRTSTFDEVRITIPPLDDVSVQWLLDNVVTTPYELRWEIRDGVVTIAAWDDPTMRPRLRYFDVSDLVPKMRSFRGDWSFLDRPCEAPPEPGVVDGRAPPSRATVLLDRIRSVVDPASWTADGVSLDLKNGTLIVKNVEVAIDHVSQFLKEVRDGRQPALDLPPPPPPPDRPHENASWPVFDLVGHSSEDGSVTAAEDGAPRPPYAPGALVAVLRASVEYDVWTMRCASLTLADGTLRAHLDEPSIERIDRLIGELRVRTTRPPRRGEVERETKPGLPSFIWNPR